ncbi:MAG TPA: 2,5-diamino-6-(ribosylamino)-4(3H)-pyrimidinone 5'-phosphate reductase [Candidatus Saccharimonadales bacterium]|nr:2,5-diamino-6-(ribosylamino)-4(3H)-pyrimidinone 5'-phosphate reductase [Candidatus Saccharimonadales bacterium]
MKVILNAASSIDGRIATSKGDTKISSISDLRRVHILRSEVDAILVGITTVINDDPLLTVRKKTSKKRLNDQNRIAVSNPIRIIVDGKAKIPLHSTIVKTANQIETRIAVTKNAPLKKLKKLQEKGLKIMVIEHDPKEKGRVDLKKLFDFLERDGVSKILVEGGGEINWSLISNNLFDELIVTISPLIIGGRKATSLVGGKGYDTISESTKMKLAKLQKKNTGEVVLYYRNNNKSKTIKD